MKQLFSGVATLFSETGKASDGQLVITDEQLSFSMRGRTKEKPLDLATLKVERAEVSQGMLIRRKKTAISLLFSDGQRITFLPEYSNSIMIESLFQEFSQAILNAKQTKSTKETETQPVNTLTDTLQESLKSSSAPTTTILPETQKGAPQQESTPIIVPRRRRAHITDLNKVNDEPQNTNNFDSRIQPVESNKETEEALSPIGKAELPSETLLSHSIGVGPVESEEDINEPEEDIFGELQGSPVTYEYIPDQDDLNSQAYAANKWIAEEKLRREAQEREQLAKVISAREEAEKREQEEADTDATVAAEEEDRERSVIDLQEKFKALLQTKQKPNWPDVQAESINTSGVSERIIDSDCPLSIAEFSQKINVNVTIIKSWMRSNKLRLAANGILSIEQQSAIINHFIYSDTTLDETQVSVQVTTDTSISSANAMPALTEPKFVYEKTPRVMIEDRCRELVNVGSQMISSVRDAEHTIVSGSTVAIDILNCQFVQFGDNTTSIAMPLYAMKSQDSYYPCHSHGIYHENLVSAYEALIKSPHVEIQRRIISDSIKDLQITSSGKVCIMPDTVDDFNAGFRKQCTGIFQVPRSIAAMYTQSVLLPKEKLSNSVLCLDYDGECVSAVQIDRITVDGHELLLRKGRRKIDGNHPSYRSIMEDYLSKYQSKHHISIPRKKVNELINTKLIMQIISNPDKKYLIDVNGVVICLQADLDLMDELANAIYQDALDISAAKNSEVLVLFNYNFQNLFYTTEFLQYGCSEILARKEQGLTLWREYLPELQLEVIQNGTYSKIKLIKDDVSQDIRQGAGYALDEEIEIKVDHGVIVLPANTENTCYLLPLERQTYGFEEPDKMAKFEVTEPLLEDKQVELRVFYKYGDESSYKLKATILDTGEEIPSQWCDTEQLSNPVPTYEYAQQNTQAQSMAMLTVIFDRFLKEMHQTTRPLRMQNTPEYNSTVYKEKKDSKSFLSKYLEPNYPNRRWDLKWPFKGVYSCFKKENEEEAYQLIRDMVANGQLECIADVLVGRLPTGHNLDVRPTPEGYTELQILTNHLGDLVRQFGVMFTYTDKEIPGIAAIIDDILFFFKNSKNRRIENWAAISTYVPLKYDPYKIWPTFQRELMRLSNKSKDVIDELRGISGVCYQTQDWIFSLYDSTNGTANVNRIIKGIFTYLKGKEWLSAEVYNLSKMRDVLELLLAICLLRKRNPLLLDCNSADTKQLVKQLKTINEELKEITSTKKTSGTLSPRIHGIQVPDSLSNVFPLIYALIQTLSGGQSVNLIGYSDD